MRTALAVLAVLGLFSAAFAGGDDGGDDGGAVASDLDALRGCGTMRWDDPRPGCVASLQRMLQVRGAPIEVTGHYLAETTKYLAEFQTGRGLPADGVLDGRTLVALADSSDDPAGWDPRRDCVSLHRPTRGPDGSRGPCVTILRQRLTGHGIASGDRDVFDDDAAAAVTAFQARAGLPPNGVAGPLTRRALYGSIPPSGVVQRCTSRGCVIVLRREVARDIAAVLPDNPVLRSALVNSVSAVLCALVRAAPGVTAVCQAVGSHILAVFADRTVQAADQHACLLVEVGYPSGKTDWFPVKIEPTQGAGCRD